MPLIKSRSKEAFTSNVKAEMDAGRPQKQALAIAYRVMRGHASGGRVRSESTEHEQARRDADKAARPSSTIGRLIWPEEMALRDAKRRPYEATMNAAGSYADGGAALPMSFAARSGAKMLERSGMIRSPVAGRTDKLPMSVRANSFVIPADVVSGVGQGNSLAGANALNRMFKTGPGGAAMPHPRGAPMRSAPMKMPTAGMMRGRQGFADGGLAPDTNGDSVDIVTAGGEFLVPPEIVAQIGGGDVRNGHDILDAMVMKIRQKTIKTLRKLPRPKKT